MALPATDVGPSGPPVTTVAVPKASSLGPVVPVAADLVIEAGAVSLWAPAVFPVTGVGSSASPVVTAPTTRITATHTCA